MAQPEHSASRPLRFLYIYPETIGPSPEKQRNALYYIGRKLSGEVLAAAMKSNRSTPQAAEAAAKAIGNMRFFSVRVTSIKQPFQKVAEAMNYILWAARCRKKYGDYDAIVAHGPYRTGVIGVILSLLWRKPLVVEFPGHPLNGLRLDTTFFGRLKVRIAPRVLGFVVRRSHALRLLYPSQLLDVPGLDHEDVRRKAHVFHEFVPISSIPRGNNELRTSEILFAGFPWQLKGVDLLIDAFLRLAEDFPGATLAIVGYCPDISPWRERAMNSPRVMFVRPLSHEALLDRIARAAVFVLPSRTEAMGRVLLEAMAAGTPVVASRVDGIPHYVREGVDGLLFTSENSAELEAALRQVLTNLGGARFRADTASAKTHHLYNEEKYAEHFECVIRSAVQSFAMISAKREPI